MTAPRLLPGPWFVQGAVRVFARVPGGAVMVAHCGRSSALTHAQAVAHARAVAALPDLIAALEELVAEFDADDAEAASRPGCGGINETGGVTYARAVLAKIRGEA